MTGYGLHLIQHNNGRWGFVGSVPISLCWKRKDGSELTEQNIADLPYMSAPGICGFTTRAWETQADAQAALAALDNTIELKSIHPLS